MKPIHIINAAILVFIGTVALLMFTIHNEDYSGDEAIPPASVAPTAITTEEAINYIEQGHAILRMALDAFNDEPSRAMGSALLQITDEYNRMLGGLCQVEGTDAQCTEAQDTIVQSYTALFEYAKELEAQP